MPLSWPPELYPAEILNLKGPDLGSSSLTPTANQSMSQLRGTNKLDDLF